MSRGDNFPESPFIEHPILGVDLISSLVTPEVEERLNKSLAEVRAKAEPSQFPGVEAIVRPSGRIEISRTGDIGRGLTSEATQQLMMEQNPHMYAELGVVREKD